MKKTTNVLERPLLIFFIVSFLFFGLAPKAHAYVGILDLNVTEIPNTIFAGVSGVANPVTAGMTTAEKIKNFIIDPVARVALKMIIKKLTAQTVNWINSGFQGSPGFVQDPGQFFLGVGDQVASQYLSNTTFNQLCTPFQAQVRLALVKNYLQDQNNYSCTLDKIKDNYEAFANDFTQGGWQGWFEMTQTSGGNPYDAYFAAQTSLSQKVSTQVNKYQQQLQEGGGFLSFEKCKPGKALTQEDIDKYDYDNGDGAAEADGFFVGYCSKDNMETVTPGSVISSQLNKALGTDLSQLELAKSVDEIATALITALFSRVMGNTGLAQGTSGAIPEVIVPDNNKPMITLLAKSPMTIQVMSQAQGQDGTVVGTSGTFSDPGAFAYDTKDGDISDRIIATGNVDVNTPGTYTVTYNVTNSKGVKADPVQLEVDVIQGSGGGGTIPPVTCVTDPVTGVMTCTVPNPTPAPVNACGTPPPFNDSLNATSGNRGSLAYNSVSNNWLVVSGWAGVNGRIMGNSGSPVSSPFQLTNHSVGSAKVAYAPDINKYLIIWIEWDDTANAGPSVILGRFINPDGSYSGNQFQVINDNYPATASFIYPNTQLRYDQINKKFVFAREVRTPTITTHVVTIDQNGVVGQDVEFDGCDTGCDSPVLAVGENNGKSEYCVAYDNRNQYGIVVRKMDPLTGTLGEKTFVTTSVGPVDATITYDSVDSRYLVTWSTNAKTYGKILNSCNGDDGGNVVVLNPMAAAAMTAYNSKSNLYAIIGQDQNDCGNTYYLADADGQMLTSSGRKLVPDGRIGNFYPSIAANTNDGTFAMTSSRDYEITRFMPNLGIRMVSLNGLHFTVPTGVLTSVPSSLWTVSR